jgi:iron-sulfur cluster repair protein YtfE (RIC family)
MDLRRHVCRALHEDHTATISLLARLETLIGSHRPNQPPPTGDSATVRLLKDLIAAVDTEIAPHFAFEEESVFPLLAEAGDGEMQTHLVEEHRTILPLARRLAEIAKGARSAGIAAEAWAQFHATAAELIERLASHVQKEEMGLLPALDGLLDEETDGRLAVEFAARR